MENNLSRLNEIHGAFDPAEAAKVLETLDAVWTVLNNELPLNEAFNSIVKIVPQGLDQSGLPVVKITYKDQTYRSEGFSTTEWVLTEQFTSLNEEVGEITLNYLQAPVNRDEFAFSPTEKLLINQIARILESYINSKISAHRYSQAGERIKELSTINRTTKIIDHGKEEDDVLQQIVFSLPEGWQYPAIAEARIRYGDKEYKTEHFEETKWIQTQRFKTVDSQIGTIDVCYMRTLPTLPSDPFLPEERDLLVNIAKLISDYLNSNLAQNERFKLQERVKELKVTNEMTRIIGLQMSVEYTLKQLVEVIPKGMQHPEFAVARIVYDNRKFVSHGFVETPWLLRKGFKTVNGKMGAIEIMYLNEMEKTKEELFLNEENDLIDTLSSHIEGYLNGVEAQNIIDQTKQTSTDSNVDKHKIGKKSKHLLQNFMHKNNAARDIYHDLMRFKVKEILLVANLYDAFAIENEGRFTEQIMGGFYQMHLSSLPRVTGVTTYEEAIGKLKEKHYDLIIVMVGVEKKALLNLSRMVKEDYPYIPIFMLLNSDKDIPYFEKRKEELGVLDEIFVWHGDPKVFSSMVYHLEDKVNVENDTEIGLARVILLVEDSVRYYSRYLPLLYASVLEQTRRLIDDIQGDELYSILRLKARPKVLLAKNYEEALDIFVRYKDYLLCLITDVEFTRRGIMAPNAGFELASFAKEQIKDLPVILQSSKIEYSQDAYDLKTTFINKNSESLIQEIKSFIQHYLGFGNFAYKDKDGQIIAVAGNLKEFEHHLKQVPIGSVVYHAKKNHFSLWLMARGEMKIAKMIAPYRISDFENEEGVRTYLLDVIKKDREEKNQGKVIDFDEVDTIDENHVYSMSSGSLGGKGRGLSFINTLLYNFDFETYVPGIRIKTPRTTVIGTNEFELFVAHNNLHEIAYREVSYQQIKSIFLKGELSDELMQRLKRLLTIFTSPIAVRSSGLLEDSQKQPFAGVFDTYILPNNHQSGSERLKQLCDAIKLVYASVYSEAALAFTEAVDFKIEEEKMAVVIQEAVGHQHGSVFYPHLSGVAQSYNFYSYGYMNPEDGFAVLALGLGKYVVDGEKAWRFCPVYPSLENNSPKDQLKNSQTEFYAVDLKKKKPNLMEGDTAGLIRLDYVEAEMHGTLTHLASVYVPNDEIIEPSLKSSGPRILNFADILKYDYIPLSKAIEVVLDVVEEAMGSSVEIEFAVDLNADDNQGAIFQLLQIKPLLGGDQNYSIDMRQVDESKIIIQSMQSMGNGVNDNINEVIFIKQEHFERSKTRQMALELERLNTKMKSRQENYILIGPGRWGTRDPYIGIPVSWGQISNAQMIVETDLEGFPLEASGGSHFFHNVTSMKVGYCSILQGSGEGVIKWDVLKEQELLEETYYFKHIRFKEHLMIRMDGKKRKAIVTYGDES